MFTEMGAVVHALPAAEIAAAMDRGLLDAAEFNNPTSDRILGLTDVAKVCMLRSFHQSAENFEVLFNRRVFSQLSDDLKAIVGYAVQAASADMSWKAIDRYSSDYQQMARRQGVRFEKTPDSVLQAQLDAWDIVTERKSRQNPMFRRVQESMREFAAARDAVARRDDGRPPDGLGPFLRPRQDLTRLRGGAHGCACDQWHSAGPARALHWPHPTNRPCDCSQGPFAIVQPNAEQQPR